MIDEKYIDLATAYLQDSMSPEQRAELNELIEQGKIDILDLKEMELLYERMGTIKTPGPDSALRDRFYAMLEEEKVRHGTNLSRMIPEWITPHRKHFEFRQLAYALGIFLIGLLIGGIYAPISNQDEQIDRLTSEVYRMREIMMINLLDNSSPIERLRGVNISNEIRPVDNRVADALLQTLNNDSNVNVRMAAVNALVHHASNPAVRQGLVNSITTQESPIVQAALADAMLALQEKQSVDEFKKLLEQNELDKNVRNKLENTIAALS